LDKLIQHKDENASAKRRTIIVIAHRLSTVRNADKIVVLGSPEGTSTAVNGSVILEEGNHDELMNLEKGFYRALVGTTHRSSEAGLVDDITGPTEEDTANEAVMMKSRVDAAEEKNASVADTKSVKTDEEDKKGLLAVLFGTRDKKENEKKKQLAANKTRVWQYTKPEFGWIAFGSWYVVLHFFAFVQIAFSTD